jgi:hypothetical protein
MAAGFSRVGFVRFVTPLAAACFDAWGLCQIFRLHDVDAWRYLFDELKHAPELHIAFVC